MKIISEYDVPQDAWYFQENSHPKWMPYSVLMEIALQPCGFISAYSGAMLLYPELDLHYRNLDGKGRFLCHPHLQGKTISAVIELLSTVASGDTIIQTHRFLLSYEGIEFYKGDTVFGYFTDEALANQTGLDGGKSVPPRFKLRTEKKFRKYVLGQRDGLVTPGSSERPHWKIPGGKFSLLDYVYVAADGSDEGYGYVYGIRQVKPEDWFFPCHFHQDPVMPGSLGVEAILQAMQVYAIDQKLGEEYSNPRFSPVLSQVQWKYRGQVIPETKEMQLEVWIRAIRRESEQLVIIADASLWRDELRIYEISSIALAVNEA